MKKNLLVLFIFCWAAVASAAPLDRKDVPQPLQAWVDWVLHGEQEDACPIIYNNGDQKICAWPSFFNLEVKSASAAFSQEWRVYADDAWLFLPGNGALWPQEVMLNGVAHPVGRRSGRPAVHVTAPGQYLISGIFLFDRLPEWLRVPEQTGLIRLTINGKAVAFPDLDKEGRLWLREEGAPASTGEGRENTLQVRVNRLVEDDIPLRLVTRLELSVSGQHREVRLGQVNTAAFIPMQIDSALPAKIDGDGTLLVQVRPGQWVVEVVLRHKGPVSALSLKIAGNFGVDEEMWAFNARRDLRLVSIEGPAQVDPSQTTVPDSWRQYSVYLMTTADTMAFVEKQRGDPKPVPDQLNLDRTFWLNFDGRGYSVRDQINGTMTAGWRLEMDPPQELGRVTVNGQEQFITRLKSSGNAGVEMRHGNVDLTAESRLARAGRLPVVGWDHDFKSVKGRLNLPPGWTLIHAVGIDNIRQTWVGQWNLLGLFLVLLIAVLVTRLSNWRWGIFSLITVVLLHNEPNAPFTVWLHLLATIVLLRVLPKGKMRTLVDYYRFGAIVVLLVISVPFVVIQIRDGIYPRLEQAWQVAGPFGERVGAGRQAEGAYDIMNEEVTQALPDEEGLIEAYEAMPMEAASMPVQSLKKAAGGAKSRSAQVQMIDTRAMVQTGPGIPTWHWRQIPFSWDGPVARGAQMRFVFLSPKVNLILAFVRVLLLAAMIFQIVGLSFIARAGIGFFKLGPAACVAPLLLLCSLIFAPMAHAADVFPPDDLLQELKARLTEKDMPACLPDCATSARLKLVIDGASLRLRMEVDALYDNVAVPLPGSAQHWLPETVLVDNQPNVELYRSPASANLWLRVGAGHHEIDLRGRLPQRQIVQLPLPLKPYYVEAQVDGWRLDGLHDNGVADDQLQFTRLGRGKDGAAKAVDEVFDSGLLPPFLKVTRTISLGVTWGVETTVKRLTPVGAAVVVAIPLLAGESVTSDIPVENGRVLLNMGPKQQVFRWSSSLAVADQLVLTAPDTLDWTEVWTVNPGPDWHVDMAGIPVISHQDRTGAWLPEWRPWPGETVTLKLTRPEGIGGQTHTVENSRLVVRPGQRVTETQLDMSVRSSRGGRQIVVLPAGAVLQAVTVDGQSQPVHQNGNNVTLPLMPGLQKIKLTWREDKGLTWKWLTPQVDLGIPSVDAFITVQMPDNRWLLKCGGPYVGPAVMWWALALMGVLTAVVLGQLKAMPLRFRHWVLLGVGMSQASLLLTFPVAIWLLLLGYRTTIGERLFGLAFNLFQLLLLALTGVTLAAMLYSVQQGLMGYPDMLIIGNGSSNFILNWYQDIAATELPRAWVVSLPLYVYRMLMLAWAMWLVFAATGWVRWAWERFTQPVLDVVDLPGQDQPGETDTP